MSLSAYDMSVGTFAPMLRTLSTILDKAIEHAAAKGLAPGALANARLAPDMFPLIQQVQVACDQAKAGAARLTGVEAPVFEDNEETLEALKVRIDRTLAFLDGLTVEAFENYEGRDVVMPVPGGVEFHMTAAQALRDWALPNFYFHLVTAYDILRREGVELGKRDYLSRVAVYMRPSANAG